MAPSLNSFKNRLDKYWNDQKLYYEDTCRYESQVRNESFIENKESGEE